MWSLTSCFFGQNVWFYGKCSNKFGQMPSCYVSTKLSKHGSKMCCGNGCGSCLCKKYLIKKKKELLFLNNIFYVLYKTFMSLLSETKTTVVSSEQLTTGTITAGVVKTEGLSAQVAVLDDVTTTNLVSTGIEFGGFAVSHQNQIVAGGSQGDIVFSADGFTYTTVSLPNNPPSANALFKGSVNGVATDGHKWIAVASQALGAGPIMGISYNGIGWTAHPSPPVPPNPVTLTGVAYLNNLWLCGGADGVMFYSLDGLTWTACAGVGVGSFVKGFAYGQGKWVVVGAPGMLSDVTQAYSLDGINWTPGLGAFLTGACNSVAANATLFVAYGLENMGLNMMRVSTDGITWTLAPNPPPTTFGYSIAVNPEGNFWVSSGEGARLYYSTDGLNWTNSGFTAVGSMYLAYDGVKFVGLGEGIGGANKDSAISYDGVNWGNNVGPKYFNERASCIATNSARGFLCTGRLL